MIDGNILVKSVAFSIVLSVLALGLGACGNTFVGVGKDIIKMGESMNKPDEPSKPKSESK